MGFRIPSDGVSDRFRQRIARSAQAQEDEERRRREKVQRQIAHREAQEETRLFKDRMAFNLYLLAGRILDRLEEQRDRNMPAGLNDEWNEQFREAIEVLPEARQFAEDCVMYCVKEKE